MLCRECPGRCFGAVIVPLVHLGAFFRILENKLIGYVDDSTVLSAVPSPCVRVAVAESLKSDLGQVSEYRDLWGMKLNAIKTKTIIVFRSHTMYDPH